MMRVTMRVSRLGGQLIIIPARESEDLNQLMRIHSTSVPAPLWLISEVTCPIISLL
jgi:hypothetical protein